MSAAIKVKAGSVITIELPGLTAVRIDTVNGLIAVDGISGTAAPGEGWVDWNVINLQHGTYGDFHQLRPADECSDSDCVERGEHDRAAVSGTERQDGGDGEVSLAYCCEVCDATDPRWNLTRRGDVVTSWACDDDHLAEVASRMQRDHEVTELIVTDSRKARKWAAIGRALDGIARDTP